MLYGNCDWKTPFPSEPLSENLRSQPCCYHHCSSLGRFLFQSIPLLSPWGQPKTHSSTVCRSQHVRKPIGLKGRRTKRAKSGNSVELRFPLTQYLNFRFRLRPETLQFLLELFQKLYNFCWSLTRLLLYSLSSPHGPILKPGIESTCHGPQKISSNQYYYFFLNPPTILAAF